MLPSVVSEFTPWASLLGGMMIGLSSLLVFYLFGRVAGISGITTGGLLAPAQDWLWRAAFLAGLVVAPLFLKLFDEDWPGVMTLAQATVSDNYPGMIVAGLAVGFGTVLGSGCTSGHGVCGLGRRSARSLVAVVTFMTTAAITVAVLRHFP